jgi:hypothetical protein
MYIVKTKFQARKSKFVAQINKINESYSKTVHEALSIEEILDVLQMNVQHHQFAHQRNEVKTVTVEKNMM